MKYQKEVKIGITVVAAVFFLIWGIFYLKGRNIFASNRTFFAVYTDVGGLVVASPVYVNGLKVGQVSSIEIDKKNFKNIIVGFAIDNDDIQIPDNSKANFVSADLFNKAIYLVMGDSKKLLATGDTLISERQLSLQENIYREMAPLKEKTQQLIGSIDSIIDIVSGVMGRNSGELDESFKGVRRAILKFENTAINLDELIANERVRISNILSKVDNIATTVSTNSPKIVKTLDNLAKISDSLANSDLSGTINKAQSTMDELSKITTKINNGEGTLGALVKSDSLFNALVKTNDEIQRLVENMKEHPYRYVHLSVFGKREKGMKLDARDERKLKEMLKNQKDPSNGNN